jgi:hypothetical protein
MPTYEASAVSRAHPGAAWDVWIDVARWGESEHIESARIDGEFRPGAVITSKARGMPGSTLKVTRVEPPALWVDESRFPGVRMTFDHVIEPTPDGTVLTERANIRGPLAPMIGALLGRRLEALFSASVAHVARTAETRGP